MSGPHGPQLGMSFGPNTMIDFTGMKNLGLTSSLASVSPTPTALSNISQTWAAVRIYAEFPTDTSDPDPQNRSTSSSPDPVTERRAPEYQPMPVPISPHNPHLESVRPP